RYGGWLSNGTGSMVLKGCHKPGAVAAIIAEPVDVYSIVRRIGRNFKINCLADRDAHCGGIAFDIRARGSRLQKPVGHRRARSLVFQYDGIYGHDHQSELLLPVGKVWPLGRHGVWVSKSRAKWGTWGDSKHLGREFIHRKQNLHLFGSRAWARKLFSH